MENQSLMENLMELDCWILNYVLRKIVTMQLMEMSIAQRMMVMIIHGYMTRTFRFIYQ